MNLAFVLPRYHTNLVCALKALERSGYRCHLLCAKHNDRVPGFVSGYHVFAESSVTYREIANVIHNIRADLVVIRKTHRLSRLVHRICLIQRRAIVGYDLRPYLRPRHFGQLLRGMLKGRPMNRFTPVHGLSGRPDPRAAYIPFPAEAMPANVERIYAPDGTYRILCVGKLAERRKNHLLLLRALEPLADRFAFRITLVGSSGLNTSNLKEENLHALEAYAENSPLADRTTILKDVPFESMADVYRNHDICVLPARDEPLGIAPLEAMAQGCATIISSDAGSAYYVHGAEAAGLACGAVFERDNAEQLKAELATLMSDRDKLYVFGHNATAWTQREFAPEEFVIRFKRLIAS